MGASITLAGESLIAQKHAAQQGLDVVRFIFANVPGLDPNGPVDRAAPKPAAGQIVHVYDIPDGNAGYVNPNQVVYSSQIDSDVGDWDFNWIGLESAEGTLFAVAYVPLQIKRRNIPPLQIGNNLTRNFLVAFDGAQALTGISIDASTWQHDFTVRLAGIDERERLSNRDIYGRACFLGSSLQLEKVGSAYQLKPGVAYVEGVRMVRSAVLPVVPAAFPCTAWLDVTLQRELSDVVASWQVVFTADRPDYTDSAGAKHYCVAIADLTNANTIIDRRSVEPIDGPLVGYFAARTGDYPNLRARGTTKDDVDLGNLPNAKSDDPTVNDSEVLATTKMVRAALDQRDGKNSVLFTTTGAITLSGLAIQAGGDWATALPAGARVLVKDQASGATNGIYDAAAGVWTRSTDADNSLEVTPGLFVTVEQGTTLADSIWHLVTDAPVVLGTTPLVFEIAANRTGVAAGTYDRVTVDKYGRVLGGTNPVAASGLQVFGAPGVFTFTVPADVTAQTVFEVEVWGGGGGGAGGANSGSAGGGGGGGGYSHKRLTGLTAGAVVTVTVGAGGPNGAWGYPGTVGGSSSFGGHCSATGGGAGQVIQGSSPAIQGGTGAGGDLNFYGDPGKPSEIWVGGCGGMAARGGGGGLGGYSAAGGAGTAPGGGGGGGDSPSGAGGPGAPGMVMIRWRSA